MRCDVCYFLFVGMQPFMSVNLFSNAAYREEQQFEEICQWFLDTLIRRKINAGTGISDGSEEQGIIFAL